MNMTDLKIEVNNYLEKGQKDKAIKLINNYYRYIDENVKTMDLKQFNRKLDNLLSIAETHGKQADFFEVKQDFNKVNNSKNEAISLLIDRYGKNAIKTLMKQSNVKSKDDVIEDLEFKIKRLTKNNPNDALDRNFNVESLKDGLKHVEQSNLNYFELHYSQLKTKEKYTLIWDISTSIIKLMSYDVRLMNIEKIKVDEESNI